MDHRLRMIEESVSGVTSLDRVHSQPEDSIIDNPIKSKSKSGRSSLRDTWFAWFSMVPRIWAGGSCVITKQQRSNAKLIVSFMRLFIKDTGYHLDESSPSYRDEVMSIGILLEGRVQSFLQTRGLNCRGSSSVLKCMRKLHKQGALNTAICRFDGLCAAGLIVDPTPMYTRQQLQTMQCQK